MKKKVVAMVIALCAFGALGVGAAAAVGSSPQATLHSHGSTGGCPYSEGSTMCCSSGYSEGCTNTTTTTTTTVTTTTTTPTTTTTHPSGPTQQQLNARNHRDVIEDARNAFRANLLGLARGSVVIGGKAGSAGTLVISVYITIGHGKRILVAVTKHAFGKYGRALGRIRLRLTRAGRRLLFSGSGNLSHYKHLKVRVTVKAVFFPANPNLRIWRVTFSRIVKV